MTLRALYFALAAALCLHVGLRPAGAQVKPDELSGIVVDDVDAKLVGDWKPSVHTRPFLNRGYLHDSAQGKGEKSATFTVKVEQDGKYHLLLAYTAGGNRAKKVPVEVTTAEGTQTVYVDQTQGPLLAGTGFHPLGEFRIEAAQPAKVVVSNAGTSQHVIVDGVRALTEEQFATAKKEEQAPPKPAVAKKEKQPEPKPEAPAFVRQPPREPKSRTTSQRLDELLIEQGVPVEDVVDDATFLRRATLDLLGRQPTVEELTKFERDESADKRAQAIERLLAHPDYGRNWANYWSDTIAWRTPVPQLTFLNWEPFEEWMAAEFNQGTSWDEIVFRMLTATGKVGDHPEATYVGFHQGARNRLAGETTRIFLGVKIACAECHDHPFVDMPQETFHGMAAFFARVKTKLPWNDSNGIVISSTGKGEHKMPGSKEMMKPTVFQGDAYDLGLADLERRKLLADWVVSGDNPYFARAYVNRIWSRLMGRGFFDPVDDMGELADSSLPEVHAALAEHFVAAQFDAREVFRVIMNTRAYQRTLEPPEGEKTDFAAADTKPLRGDEVFDSLQTAIELPNVVGKQRKATGAERFPPPPKSTRDLVDEAFGFDPSYSDDLIPRTMKQAMFLMNNAQIQKQVDASPESGTMLAKLLQEETDDAKVIDTLFRRVLAREPTSTERELLLGHVQKVGERGAAFEDVLWSLVNSTEFTTRN